jgi:hypothetical protein
MTHQENYNLSTNTFEELTRNGLEAIPELVRVILNNVMQVPRVEFVKLRDMPPWETSAEVRVWVEAAR